MLAGSLFELLLFISGIWYKRFKVVESFLNPIIEDLHKLLDFLERKLESASTNKYIFSGALSLIYLNTIVWK